MRSSLGKPPREADAAQPQLCSTSAQTREAAAAKPQSVCSVARHICRAASNASAINLLIAALLWAFAILCALASIAILIHYANSLFGVE